MNFSVIIPAYNEEENIVPLYDEIKKSLKNIGNYEIIFIDDGSKDGTLRTIKELSKKDKIVKYISFAKNSGQTQAIAAGVDFSKGTHIITLDADLQNPPEEIPGLINKLKKGNYNCVSGWRKNRRDNFKKILFSKLSFIVRKLLFNDKIHDAGCTLKIYERSCFNDFEFYGESHRFITTILQLNGYKVGEYVVKHKKRHSGKTKYGAKRLINGFLDLLFIKFWNDSSPRPLHFFGNLSFFQYFLAIFIFIEQIFKAIIISKFDLGPILVLGVLLFLNATVTFLFGFMFEIMLRSGPNGRYYKVKEMSA
ncbi:glycosyltransferase family 2 protein [Candidatus Woesearchaeota archaeon]|nr:glycosyltransferase family 2 protein [Candidatus Woesearchaeota archaeon]